MNSKPQTSVASSEFVFIPQRLKRKRIEQAGFPMRLEHLLRNAGFRVLGDLEGRRPLDFERHRGFGKSAVRALSYSLLWLRRPKARPEMGSPPTWMRIWSRAEPPFEVLRAARGVRLEDLPVSARLKHILEGLGIARLGQLHGLPSRQVHLQPNCGPGTLAELRLLIRRAEAGEFTL